MNYLFLDVDGVLNCLWSFKLDRKRNLDSSSRHSELHPRNLFCLKYFIKHTPNLSIVLTSTWRNYEFLENKLRENFEEFGVSLYISKTPRIPQRKNRGEEIEKWMSEHDVHKSQIVIFDDELIRGPLEDRHVQTSFRFGGLCLKHLKKAWEILEDSDTRWS